MAAYVNVAGLDDPKAPLFQSVDRAGRLSGRPLGRRAVLAMIKRRAAAAGLPASTCCHTFRATGITAYLSNGGTLEHAQQIAGHASPKTTKLYDRTADTVTLDEIERHRNLNGETGLSRAAVNLHHHRSDCASELKSSRRPSAPGMPERRWLMIPRGGRLFGDRRRRRRVVPAGDHGASKQKGPRGMMNGWPHEHTGMRPRGVARFVWGTAQVVVCVFSLVLLWGDTCTAQTVVFSTDRDFGPVRLSQEQLVELVGRLQAFAVARGSTASGSDGGDDATHRLSMSDGRNTVVISQEISMEALASAPAVVTSASYMGRYRNSVISEIGFRFSDRARTLEVSGQSQDQVEAVAQLAGTIIDPVETAFGGYRHRSIVGFLLFLLASCSC